MPSTEPAQHAAESDEATPRHPSPFAEQSEPKQLVVTPDDAFLSVIREGVQFLRDNQAQEAKMDAVRLQLEMQQKSEQARLVRFGLGIIALFIVGLVVLVALGKEIGALTAWGKDLLAVVLALAAGWGLHSNKRGKADD